MSIFGDPFHFVSGAASFPYEYQIAQSARFTRSESSYLSRTFGSGGNLRSWTFSFWFKLYFFSQLCLLVLLKMIRL